VVPEAHPAWGRPKLRGRRAECAAVDRLLEAARTGQSGVLVVRGEAGIGKSALLAYALDVGSEFRVARALGVESEMELAFAGLHQLCAPFLNGLERLPAPQRGALETVFGLSSGLPPDPFFVGLAVLGLLSDSALEKPLLCVVDDAQWLDQSSEQVLAFVARRLGADSIAVLFGMRFAGERDVLSGLPELVLEGLSTTDARELLASAVPVPLDARVADRIVAETRGNPLALVELPRSLSPADLAGGFELTSTGPLSARIEDSFRQRFEALPVDARLLLVLAAAEPVGDPTLLWRAAAQLGIPRQAAATAEAANLLEVGTRVTFRHPLLRSVTYGSASGEERRRVHGALAEVTDPDVDPDRRAWHAANSASGPDEDVAAELARSAGRAQGRGGVAAAAAFLEHAARLTPNARPRAARHLAAAQAKQQAGALDSALALVALAETGPLNETERANAEWLRAHVTFIQGRRTEALPLLLAAAKRLQPVDSGLARDAFVEAFLAVRYSGGAEEGREVALQLAEIYPIEALSRSPRGRDLLLAGWALLFTKGFPSGIDLLRRAMSALLTEPISEYAEVPGLWESTADIARSLWDDGSLHALASRWVQLARSAGALPALADALWIAADTHLQEGDLTAAAVLIDEADALTEAIGVAPLPWASATKLMLATCRGDERTASALIDAALREAVQRREESEISCWVEYTEAVLYNGLGRYAEAMAAAERSCEHHARGGFGWALAEYVEAAARSGEQRRATEILNRLTERTQVGGTDWALGVEARSRALLSDGTAAEELYREAIERLDRTRIRIQLARGHLVYGEWLRRERRRVEAREQLRAAYEMFDSMGAKGFADRASRELLATGEKTRARRVETRDELTAQEGQIARLAREGLSNPEIGARLFISPRTVEYHLHKVFAKLGIRSRSQLNVALE
jgi:DNA-binding CsgD family transcriptional regulator